ncbi:MAG: DegT/DnrJ/EryC1/StrS family aminotransferase [Thermodesulfobacteriota bacterium]
MHSDTLRTSETAVPHSRPTLGEEEVAAVSRVIASGRVAQGEKVRKFEEDLARFAGRKGAAAVSSGTAGLVLALAVLGAGPEREVIIPSYVCTALFHAVRQVGAVPVLADADPATGNLDPEDVEQKITKKTVALIVPHMFGLMADMDRLSKLGVPVIEDCAQAIGAKSGAGPAGSGGVLSVFSFYATKVICTGEGGMVASDSEDLLERVRDLRDYDEKPDLRVRCNYKMTDMAAAMGIVQLRRLIGFLAARAEIAKKYDRAFAPLEASLPPNDPGRIYFRYVLGLPGEAGEAAAALRARGISCARPVFRPLHSYLGLAGFANTERLWRSSLSVPIHPSLSEEDCGRVIAAVTEVLG